MAVPTGFEPAFSALTGPRVWPGYTTGPTAAKSTSGLCLSQASGASDASARPPGRAADLPMGGEVVTPHL